jgi:hypothetical protein
VLTEALEEGAPESPPALGMRREAVARGCRRARELPPHLSDQARRFGRGDADAVTRQGVGVDLPQPRAVHEGVGEVKTNGADDHVRVASARALPATMIPSGRARPLPPRCLGLLPRLPLVDAAVPGPRRGWRRSPPAGRRSRRLSLAFGSASDRLPSRSRQRTRRRLALRQARVCACPPPSHRCLSAANSLSGRLTSARAHSRRLRRRPSVPGTATGASRSATRGQVATTSGSSGSTAPRAWPTERPQGQVAKALVS